MRKLLPQSAYARNVITLMAGTGLAQAIPLAISPILTRLYSPEEFGVFALYMAAVSILSVLATGRYELAIVLPKSDRDAMHLVALSIMLAVIVSGLLLLVVCLFNASIARLLGAPEITRWLYWVPASTLLMGVYQSLNYWSNRKAQYRRLAVSRTVQSASTSLAQLLTGYASAGPAGLIGGQLTGQALSSAVLAKLVYREDETLINTIRKTRMFATAKKYINFPKYMIPGQLLNTASGQLPIILLNIFFGSAVVGFYSLTQRVMAAPLSLVGGALGDVYRSESAKQYALEKNCKDIFIKTIKKLILISIVFSIPFLLAGPEIFAFIFGEKWRAAGQMASMLSVMMFFQNISSPLSQTVLLANKQALDLVWQFVRFICAALSLYAGHKFFNSYYAAILIFSVSFSVLYIAHSIFQYRVAVGSEGNNE